ncbi:DUF397 domain-containing protein [Streptomyces sp. 6N223]|uniref:DUF397 domain-containing protein n=1 Tax=Streptomyces sp. 6N223 TaxID=3457412 RepID=UPI003FD4C6D0
MSAELDLSAAEWVKSSYSDGAGGDCVEFSRTFLTAAEWVKSSYSDGSGGNCVEFSRSLAPLVPVRDSKSPDGPALVFTPAHWTDFVSALGAGNLRAR